MSAQIKQSLQNHTQNQHKSKSNGGLIQFVDQRPEMVQMKKLQESANKCLPMSDSIRFQKNPVPNNLNQEVDQRSKLSNKGVTQLVGGEKISFKRSDNIAYWRGQLLLTAAIKEMKKIRGNRKEGVWAGINNKIKNNNKEGKAHDSISTQYSEGLENLKDDLQLIQLTKPFVNGHLMINGDQVIYNIPVPINSPARNESIAIIKKGDEAFSKLEEQPEEAKRTVFGKDEDGEGQYVSDSRHVMTRRFAYVEKSYWQFMEFLHTHQMEGRYQKFMRASGTTPDVLNNDNEMVKKAQLKKGKKLTLEQLAFVHQYWGSGSQQRGLSLTSTAKPGVTIGNEGENFRTNGGFRIKIDLAKIPKDKNGPILLNHYSNGGVKDAIKNGIGDVETNPLNKKSAYKYHSSVVKNRELYLEHLKPEWIESVEHHPSSEDDPGTGSSKIHKASDFKNVEQFMKSLSSETGGDQYGVGFEMALKNKKKPGGSDEDIKNGFSSGLKYLEGYSQGEKDKVQQGRKSLKGTGIFKQNTKKDWSASKHQKKKRDAENSSKTMEYVANMTIENKDHQNQTDIYRIGYVHGWLGKEKITKLSDTR